MQHLLCLYTLPNVPAITSEVILLFLNLYLHFLFSIWNPPFLFLLWPYHIPKYNSWQMKSSYTFPVEEQKPGSYCERNSIFTENEDFKWMNENLYLKLHFLLNTECSKNRMNLNIRWPLIFVCMYFSALWLLLTFSPTPHPTPQSSTSYTLHPSIKFSISHSLTFPPSNCTSPLIPLSDKIYSVSYLSYVFYCRVLDPLLLIFWMCCAGGAGIIACHCWKPCHLAFLRMKHYFPNHLLLTLSTKRGIFNHV